MFCPDAYTNKQLQYQWMSGASVSFEPGMTLSQFDLMGSPQRNSTYRRREGMRPQKKTTWLELRRFVFNFSRRI